MKKVSRPIRLYQIQGRPMLFVCGETIMAALQYYNPRLADERTYYGALISWSFLFAGDQGTPVGLPVEALMHRNLSHLYGIERREVHRNSFADLWQAIEERIAQDRVLLAWVDAHEVSDTAFHFNRMPDVSEAMVIYGYDRSADALAVLVNPQRFLGCVSLSCLPKMLMESMVYDYAVPEDLDTYPVGRIEQILWQETVEMLNGPKIGQLETGLPGMRSFIEEMKCRVDQDEEELCNWMQVVFGQMALIGPQRRRLGDNLRWLADETGASALSMCAETFGDLGQRWEVVRNLFFKGTRSDSAAMLERIRKRVQGLLSQEEEQAHFLCKWLQQYGRGL